jgi:hypothetical protein
MIVGSYKKKEVSPLFLSTAGLGWRVGFQHTFWRKSTWRHVYNGCTRTSNDRSMLLR